MESLLSSFENWIATKIDERLTVRMNTGSITNLEKIEAQIEELEESQKHLEYEIANVFDGFDVTDHNDMDTIFNENVDMVTLAENVAMRLSVTARRDEQ